MFYLILSTLVKGIFAIFLTCFIAYVFFDVAHNIECTDRGLLAYTDLYGDLRDCDNNWDRLGKGH